MSTDVAVGNEPEATIQTSVCEAYTHMPRSDDYVNQVSQLVLAMVTEVHIYADMHMW